MASERIVRALGVVMVVAVLCGAMAPEGIGWAAPPAQQIFEKAGWGLRLEHPPAWREFIDRSDVTVLGWWVSAGMFGNFALARDAGWADPEVGLEEVFWEILNRAGSTVDRLTLSDLPNRDIGGAEARGASFSAWDPKTFSTVSGYVYVFGWGDAGFGIVAAAPPAIWADFHERECNETLDTISLEGQAVEATATPTRKARVATSTPTRAVPTATRRPVGRRPDGPRRTPGATAAAATPARGDENVIFRDDFSGSGGYLTTYDAGDGLSLYSRDAYYVNVSGTDAYVFGATMPAANSKGPATPIADADLVDVAVDVDVTRRAGDGSFGIACGFEDDLTFYGLVISADGRRSVISRFHMNADDPWDGETLPAADYWLAGPERGEPHPAILTEPLATNHLRGVCARNGLALFVNDEQVVEYPLNEAPKGGVALIGVTPFVGHGLEMEFDNLVVRRLEEQPEFAAVEAGITVYQDDFEDDLSDWPEGHFEDAGGSSDWDDADGRYVATVQLKEEGRSWWTDTPPIAYRDASVEVDITQLKGASKSFAGVYVRNSVRGGYMFGISPYGQYYVGKWTKGSQTKTLVPWTDTGAIKRGLQQTNRLRVDLAGERMTLFVNGVKVREVRDAGFPGGYFRLLAASGEDRPATFAFDNFSIRAP